MELRIYKSKKKLELWENGHCVKTYPIGIGKNEKGHKHTEGDLKTPEGEYRVCVKNPKSKYFLSLGLNYPNNEDARLGFEKGMLSREEFDTICEANNGGKTPLWKTALGGEIFIHGELEKKDWTEGCVRMNNPDIEELYKKTEIGTRVIIFA